MGNVDLSASLIDEIAHWPGRHRTIAKGHLRYGKVPFKLYEKSLSLGFRMGINNFWLAFQHKASWTTVALVGDLFGVEMFKHTVLNINVKGHDPIEKAIHIR